jgi:protein required for attachment to host cells
MRIEHDALVVLADGRKALFARNVGTALEPRLEVRQVLEAEPNPPTHVQGADRPGRAHHSASPGRSAVGQTDWHAQAETEFVKRVAEAVERLCRSDDVRHLLLVAAPRALADLRTALPASVRDRAVGEIDKDLTNHPIPEVEKILAGL